MSLLRVQNPQKVFTINNTPMFYAFAQILKEVYLLKDWKRVCFTVSQVSKD